METIDYFNQEQFEDHLNSFDPENYNAIEFKGMDRSLQIQKICELYRYIKPVLKIVLAIPFIGRKVKNIIRTFIEYMDALCPGIPN